MIVFWFKILRGPQDVCEPETVEVGESPMKAFMLFESDKSDPLNQRRYVGFKYGTCGAKVVYDVPNDPDGMPPQEQLIKAIGALLKFTLDRAEGIRKGIE